MQRDTRHSVGCHGFDVERCCGFVGGSYYVSVSLALLVMCNWQPSNRNIISGKGHADFSGHEGYWMPTTAESLVFDKQYYEEMVRRTWRPRNVGAKEEDFQTGTEDTHEEPQLMLKADMCFWYDTDNYYPCCSRTNRWLGDTNRCDHEEVYSDNECTRYDDESSRMEAVQSVVEFLGGGYPNENNQVSLFTPILAPNTT
jgi:hypothetical protein